MIFDVVVVDFLTQDVILAELDLYWFKRIKKLAFFGI